MNLSMRSSASCSSAAEGGIYRELVIREGAPAPDDAKR